jgi:ribosome maturation factor RimP
MDIVSRVFDIARPLARAEGAEVLDVTYAPEGGQHVLRLTIERDGGGTSTDDCSAISRAVSTSLDILDFIPDRYILEVSSAGLTRPLKTLADLKRNTGALVRIRFAHSQVPDLVGTLAQAEESGVIVIGPGGSRIPVAHPEIAQIRREVDVDALLARQERRL